MTLDDFIPLPGLTARIGRTPVTVKQYEAFRPGHRAKIAEQYGKVFARPYHPAVGVTWHDAMQYCAWLGQRLKAEVRLSTDAEWMAAAGDKTYPWGDEFDSRKCTTRESGIRHTTPVDAYPAGASPLGVLDLAGNVYEWGAEEDDGSRRLRGGAWFGTAGYARSAYRRDDTPDYANSLVGFRCVVVPHAPDVAVPCVLGAVRPTLRAFRATVKVAYRKLTLAQRRKALAICRAEFTT